MKIMSVLWLPFCLLTLQILEASAFLPHNLEFPSRAPVVPAPFRASLVSLNAYIPPELSENPDGRTTVARKLYPKIGDIVRYYDLDGGKTDGEVKVGKITFIQKNMGGEGSGWTTEVTQLEDTGDGYFADFPPRKRKRVKSLRDLAQVSPIAASFVRTESAFKIPISKSTGMPVVRQERYDVEGFEGPFSGENAINQEVVESDLIVYGKLKSNLLRNVAITGVAGTVIADLVKGQEDAALYASGVLASLAYVYFLTVKTDTLATPKSRFGQFLSALRFAGLPAVLAIIALYNRSLGDMNPASQDSIFSSVTTEQFAAVIIGFLTYRLPLFALQISEAFRDRNDEDGMEMPGSAGVALKLMKRSKESKQSPISVTTSYPILLVSGPLAAGREKLVRSLLEEDGSKFVAPVKTDRMLEGVTFERFEERDEILSVDKTGRYGLTREGIVEAAKKCGADRAVVIDAEVNLVKKLVRYPELRLIGVWVGLSNVKDFEKNFEAMIDSGEMKIPEDESRESLIRARIRDTVQEIEYGISSGVFEFTILNENEEESMKQLREAAAYCFR